MKRKSCGCCAFGRQAGDYWLLVYEYRRVVKAINVVDVNYCGMSFCDHLVAV